MLHVLIKKYLLLKYLKNMGIFSLFFLISCSPIKKSEFTILGERLYKQDRTAPEISNLVPANQETDVSINQNLEITFDDEVTLNAALNNTPSIYIKLVSDNSEVFAYELADSEVNLNGKTLIINPAIDLDYSTDYYVEIVSAVVKNSRNLFSADLSGVSTWTFSTESSPIVPALIVSNNKGNTSEAESTATFRVRLGAAPSSNVVLNITSEDLSEGVVSPATLTFTPANWSTDQNISVTGVDDGLLDGNITYSVVVAVDDDNSDNTYQAVANSFISITNNDNEGAG